MALILIIVLSNIEKIKWHANNNSTNKYLWISLCNVIKKWWNKDILRLIIK